MSRPIAIAAPVVLSAIAGVALAGEPVTLFSDQSTGAGLTAQFRYPSSFASGPMRAGGAAGDFNRDGLQDLFVLCGGFNEPDRLYINNGDGTFTDLAADWGVDRIHAGSGIAVGDVDADGWLDVYITSLGPGSGSQTVGAHLLYINNGDGTFTESAASAGVATTSPSIPDGFGAAFGDYDLDGDLDLAVAGWELNSGGNRLFRNDGDGTFTDVTVSAILTDLTPVRGFSPRFADMNGDRYPELLWVADYSTSRYLVNNTDGTFTDQTVASGTGVDSNGMGTTIGDFNNDGLPDWYVTSIDDDYVAGRSGNMLYMNQGNHLYTETSVAAGVNDLGWGWGTLAADLNHDAHQDIVETNGWGGPYETERTYVLLNDGDATFTEPVPSGVTHMGLGRGILSFDAENDGDQDLAVFTAYSVSVPNAPMGFYRNDLPPGPTANWLRVFLDTSDEPLLAPDGIGAHVVVQAGPHTLHRWISTGSNYLSQSELSAHFGLASEATIDQLTIHWPHQKVSILTSLAANQTITVAAPCRGDVDGDGDTTVFDFGVLAPAFGSADGQPAYAPAADLDHNGIVDVFDFALFAADFACAN